MPALACGKSALKSMYSMTIYPRIDVYLDVQRANLIDLNIKEICKRFIEVQEMKHETDYAGRILRTTFICREFGSWARSSFRNLS